MFCVSEAEGNSDTEDHECPVHLRNIDLAVYLVGGVNYLDPWEATERLALAHYRECSANDCLTPHNRS